MDLNGQRGEMEAWESVAGATELGDRGFEPGCELREFDLLYTLCFYGSPGHPVCLAGWSPWLLFGVWL